MAYFVPLLFTKHILETKGHKKSEYNMNQDNYGCKNENTKSNT